MISSIQSHSAINADAIHSSSLHGSRSKVESKPTLTQGSWPESKGTSANAKKEDTHNGGNNLLRSMLNFLTDVLPTPLPILRHYFPNLFKV